MSEVEKLEACPFCGGAAEINQIGNEHTKSRGFEVKCLTWGCATKKRAMVIRQPIEKARGFAVAAWNRRPTLQSQARRVEELEGALRQIEDMAPATAEMSLAHMMADIARFALSEGSVSSRELAPPDESGDAQERANERPRG